MKNSVIGCCKYSNKGQMICWKEWVNRTNRSNHWVWWM